MQGLFLYFFNKSLGAIFVVFAVMAVGLLLKKSPKIYSYLLWLIVFLYLVFPAFLKTRYRKLPDNWKIYSQAAEITGTAAVRSTWKDAFILEAVTWIWLLGIVTMFSYSLFRYLKLRSKLKNSIYLGNLVYQSEYLKTPFVFGLLHPGIYLPANLEKKEAGFILMHERIHIKRKDYLIKPAAYLILILHWYNPVVWLAYYMMCSDMEMSCDDAAITRLNHNERKEYAMSLLSMSTKHTPNIPVGFSKNKVKTRIANIVKKRKNSLYFNILPVLALIFIGGFLFSAEPKPVMAKVNTTTLCVREVPDEKAEVIGLLAMDDTVKALEESEDGFTKIEFDKKKVYVMSEYITMLSEGSSLRSERSWKEG